MIYSKNVLEIKLVVWLAIVAKNIGSTKSNNWRTKFVIKKFVIP